MTAILDTPAARICAGVRELLPMLQASVEATDRERRVPADVIAALRAAGVYRMLVPQELGGEPVDLQGFLDVIELTAQGNAAAGWDVATSSMGTQYALWLSREGTNRIYQHGPDVSFAGSIAGGLGRAVITEGGYLVSGRWGFASGSGEAQWIAGNCDVYEGGSPRLGADSHPQRMIAFFPAESVTIHDTWKVVGLRGTGSHDWSVNNAFVPAPLAVIAPAEAPYPGTLYRLPSRAFSAVHFSAVATGIARCAIDYLVDLAQHKTATLERQYTQTQDLLCERVQVQEAVARAEVLLESARAYRARIVADVWAAAESGEPISLDLRARLRLAGTNAAESAKRAVDLMFEAGGTTGIADASPLSHCFRNVHMVAQNIVVYTMNYAPVGRVLMGMDPGTPLF